MFSGLGDIAEKYAFKQIVFFCFAGLGRESMIFYYERGKILRSNKLIKNKNTTHLKITELVYSVEHNLEARV